MPGSVLLAAQVYNRELENEMEDFMLSAYDATCELESGLSGPPTFTVRYLPMGRGKSRTVIETGVALERLRPAPPNSSPQEVLRCPLPSCAPFALHVSDSPMVPHNMSCDHSGQSLQSMCLGTSPPAPDNCIDWCVCGVAVNPARQSVSALLVQQARLCAGVRHSR